MSIQDYKAVRNNLTERDFEEDETEDEEKEEDEDSDEIIE